MPSSIIIITEPLNEPDVTEESWVVVWNYAFGHPRMRQHAAFCGQVLTIRPLTDEVIWIEGSHYDRDPITKEPIIKPMQFSMNYAGLALYPGGFLSPTHRTFTIPSGINPWDHHGISVEHQIEAPPQKKSPVEASRLGARRPRR